MKALNAFVARFIMHCEYYEGFKCVRNLTMNIMNALNVRNLTANFTKSLIVLEILLQILQNL